MSKTAIKIVYRGGTGEVVEKKSRFIATVQSVGNEEEAMAFVADIRKKYWDARHHCYAFVVGDANQLARCSDDGEPAGTAGRPMLDVLLKEEVHNAVVVVTRYFGGTLLGTGGLVRAYQSAVQAGLCNSLIVERENGLMVNIHTDYNGVGKIQYLLAKEKIHTLDTIYNEKVELQAIVPLCKFPSAEKAITEATNGKALILPGEEVKFAKVEDEFVILEKN